MTIEWNTYRIRDVAEIYDGPHATPKTVEHGPVFLGINALENGRLNLKQTRHITENDYKFWTRRVAPKEGDIVFSYETRIGEAAIIPKGLRCCLGRRLGLVRPDARKLDTRFFLYLYLSPEFQELLRSRTVQGSTVDRILLTEFPDYPVRLPPLREQKKIASVLGTLDDKIELNRQLGETLEAMARAIFKSWFVDFDPVRSKTEGRQPAGMNAETAALFPDAMNEDATPKGWVPTEVAQFTSLNPESWSRTTAPAEIEYVDLSNTKWGTIETTRRYDWTDAPSRARRILCHGDVIIGTVRPGNGSYAFVSVDGLTGSTGFAVLRPNKAEFREFVYFATTSAENIKRLSHLADGAAYPAVRPEMVAKTEVPLTDERIIARYSGIVRPILSCIEEKKRENQTLAKIRDILLPRLVSGSIRVNEAPQEFATK